MGEVVLSMKGICKSYFGNTVLDHVDFELQRGTIHALLGANGAGKSTLMKILTGGEIAESGEIEIGGKTYRALTPQSAREAGIGIVHQEFAQCQDMTVTDNILLGNEIVGKFGLVKRRKSENEIRELLKSLKVDVKSTDRIRDLSAANQQLIEIAKGIHSNPEVLVLDEPTATLTLEETDTLFQFLRRLRERGVSVIYITHRLQEVMDIADVMTILRDGRMIATKRVEETNINEIVSMMIGRESGKEFPDIHRCSTKEIALEVKNLSDGIRLRHVNLHVKKGEIVGLAGLVGCGQQELYRCIVGLQKATEGEAMFCGNHMKSSVAAAVECGMGIVSESRKLDGLFLSESIRFNSSMVNLSKYRNGPFINKKKESAAVKDIVDRLKLKYHSLETGTQFLSGGNQQKVVLAKWLCCNTKFLIINEPTRGIDVGAKYDIYQALIALAEQGVAILVISSDFNEIAGLCERVYIIRDGTITAELENGNLTEEKLMIYAADKDCSAKEIEA